MSQFDDTPYTDNVIRPFFDNHPEACQRKDSRVRSIARAIVEADSLTDFTINFFDNYVAIQRAEAKMRERG